MMLKESKRSGTYRGKNKRIYLVHNPFVCIRPRQQNLLKRIKSTTLILTEFTEEISVSVPRSLRSF